MRRASIATACFALGLMGCQGQIGDPDSSVEPTTTPIPPDDVTFSLGEQNPQLLPFWVRFDRVVALLGVPSAHPMFDALKASRLLLGDYDYAVGVKPDRMWSSSRMSVWAKALKPICASAEMRQLYPALDTDATDVVALASDAFGRNVQPEEVAFDLSTLNLVAAENRYQTVCLAILSSAEFVLQ